MVLVRFLLSFVVAGDGRRTIEQRRRAAMAGDELWLRSVVQCCLHYFVSLTRRVN